MPHSTESKVNSNSLSEGKKRRKRRRCSCLYGICGGCYGGWYFAPFYGKGDGTSGAAIGTGPSYPQNVPSGANPGPGGINMPGIPNGPNSGMGPISMNKSFSHSLFAEAQNLWQLSEKGKA